VNPDRIRYICIQFVLPIFNERFFLFLFLRFAKLATEDEKYGGEFFKKKSEKCQNVTWMLFPIYDKLLWRDGAI